MKKLMLICAPVSSRSGYGDHARDLVRSFINLDKFDIKIFDWFIINFAKLILSFFVFIKVCVGINLIFPIFEL